VLTGERTGVILAIRVEQPQSVTRRVTQVLSIQSAQDWRRSRRVARRQLPLIHVTEKLHQAAIGGSVEGYHLKPLLVSAIRSA